MQEENNNVELEQDVEKLVEVRKDKLAELREKGKDPFEITKFDRTHTSKDVKENFSELDGKDVVIAGRIMGKRIMGKASFCHIQDMFGRLQLYVSTNDLGEEAYKEFKSYDIGDIIGVKGFVFKTKTEEISVHAKEITLLTKSLRPLPEKYHGLKDVDLRYRQRYVDMIMNPEVKDTFILRSKIIKELRRILDDKGYIEVETPILTTVATGDAARPFVTHHNTLNLDMYLRIAPELNLKRIVAGGIEKVYEIGRNFRNEGMDIKHNPEFTNIELYSAYEDYNDMMNIAEEIISTIAQNVLGTTKINYQGLELDLTPGWKRIPMVQAIKDVTGVDFNEIKTDAEAQELAKSKGLEVDELKNTRGHIINMFFEEFVEETLVQPTFIIDYPVEVSPLTKRKPSEPNMVERFELFIAGREYGHAYSELNDPIDQYERLAKQAEAKAKGDEEAGGMDEDFVNCLEIGLPPTGGLGIGLDRLIMLLTNSYSIRDILFFPTMKPLKKD